MSKVNKARGRDDSGGAGPVVPGGTYEHLGTDIFATVKEETAGFLSMVGDEVLSVSTGRWPIGSETGRLRPVFGLEALN